MEIIQLRYLITIVESDHNLTAAAKKMYTSQSALSQSIINFEKKYDIPLFHREKGRLKSLTPFGREVYRYALEIVRLHDEMMAKVNQESKMQDIVLKIGVPEIVLNTYFKDFFAEYINRHPKLRLRIFEAGSQDLAEMFEKDELDFAILAHTNLLNRKKYNEHVLVKDQLVAYMSKENPLYQKSVLSWEDMKDAEIAIFNSDFAIHQLVSAKLASEKIQNNIVLTSSSWNFIMDICSQTQMISLFSAEVAKKDLRDGMCYRNFKEPIPFNVSLWSHKKDRQIEMEEDFKNELLSFVDKVYLINDN